MPAGSWICPPCLQAGATAADVQQRQQQRQEARQRASLPNLFPDARARRRDEEAALLHGRLILKPFKQPGSQQQRSYWGRLHFRGPLFRPNYFLAVYEDADSETLSLPAAKKYLQPAAVQLPASISIPALSQQQVLQHTAAAASLQQQETTALAAVNVCVLSPPSADVAQLLCSIDFSRAATTADPVCGNQPLQRQLTQFGLQHQLQQPTLPAAVYIMAVQQGAAATAIAAAISRQPSFLACYVPGQQLPPAVQQLLQQQLSTAVIRVGGGCWVCVATGALPVSAWLQH